MEWGHFQWPWVTPDADFKVTSLFDAVYLKSGTRWLQRNTNRDLHVPYSRVSIGVINDLEW